MISTTHTQLEREGGWKKEGEEMKRVREEVGSEGKRGGEGGVESNNKCWECGGCKGSQLLTQLTSVTCTLNNNDHLPSITPEVAMSTH